MTPPGRAGVQSQRPSRSRGRRAHGAGGPQGAGGRTGPAGHRGPAGALVITSHVTASHPPAARGRAPDGGRIDSGSPAPRDHVPGGPPRGAGGPAAIQAVHRRPFCPGWAWCQSHQEPVAGRGDGQRVRVRRRLDQRAACWRAARGGPACAAAWRRTRRRQGGTRCYCDRESIPRCCHEYISIFLPK